jgi:hypothetical protein
VSSDQLHLFEGADVEVTRLTVTGSSDSTQEPRLPTGWKLGERVRFLAEGTVTKVTHARTGHGLERQHVIVIDDLSFDEQPPSAGDAVRQAVQDLHDLGATISVTKGAP